MNPITVRAILGVRLCALFFGALGMWLLTANVIESAGDFNPAYWGYYLKSQIARPTVAIILGALLLLLSRPLGRLIGQGLAE